MTEEEMQTALVQAVERFSWAWERIAVSFERLANVAESVNERDKTLNTERQ